MAPVRRSVACDINGSSDRKSIVCQLCFNQVNVHGPLDDHSTLSVISWKAWSKQFAKWILAELSISCAVSFPTSTTSIRGHGSCLSSSWNSFEQLVGEPRPLCRPQPGGTRRTAASIIAEIAGLLTSSPPVSTTPGHCSGFKFTAQIGLSGRIRGRRTLPHLKTKTATNPFSLWNPTRIARRRHLFNSGTLLTSHQSSSSSYLCDNLIRLCKYQIEQNCTYRGNTIVMI